MSSLVVQLTYLSSPSSMHRLCACVFTFFFSSPSPTELVSSIFHRLLPKHSTTKHSKMRWHSFTRIDSTSSSLSYERIHNSDIIFFLKNLVERMVHFLFDQRPERTRRCRLFAMVSNYKLYISIFFFSFFLSRRRRRSHSLPPLLWPAWRLEISLIHRSQAPRSFPPLPTFSTLSARMDSGIVEAKSNNLSQQYMKIHIDMCEESQRVGDLIFLLFSCQVSNLSTLLFASRSAWQYLNYISIQPKVFNPFDARVNLVSLQLQLQCCPFFLSSSQPSRHPSSLSHHHQQVLKQESSHRY